LVPEPTGPKRVILSALASCSCDGEEMEVLKDTVWIYDSLYVSLHLTPPDTTCPGDERSITALIDTTLNFVWADAASIPNSNTLTINPRPQISTVYSITVTQPGAPGTCPPRTAHYLATVEPNPVITIPEKYI